MEIKSLLTDNDAASPVIGVILMVAVTVILAAVIAVFVLGFGDTRATPPNTSFNYEYDAGSSNPQVVVRVAGGDSFDANQVSFVGTFKEAKKTWVETDTSITDEEAEVTAGANTELGVKTTGTNSVSNPDAYLLQVKWTSESGKTSAIIGTDTGPARRPP